MGCSKHRNINIISQVVKIMLRIMLERIRRKIKHEIAEEQYGVVAGEATRNAIFVLRML